MNTKIELLYSSASTKQRVEVVLPGAISQEQVNTIRDNLTMDGQLIAAQVGLPSPLEEALKSGEITGYDEHDHVWTSLEEWVDATPVAEELHTSEPATLDVPIDDLVERISGSVWDLMKEHDRMALPEFEMLEEQLEADQDARLHMLEGDDIPTVTERAS